MSKNDLALVAGAGGFIGGHLVKRLREEGFEKIRAVDQKPISEWYQVFEKVDNQVLDLKGLDACRIATQDAV
jgi:nucleoside-diphosphate-sugar epimerase